jgi:hypothetical protein
MRLYRFTILPLNPLFGAVKRAAANMASRVTILLPALAITR